MRNNLLSRRSYTGGGVKRTPVQAASFRAASAAAAVAAALSAAAAAEDGSSSKENVESGGGGGGVIPPSHRRDHRRIFVDSRTVGAMRAEVDDLPLPATLSSVCLALRTSDAVLEAHADAYHTRLSDDDRVKSLEIVGSYLSEISLSSSSPEERRDVRKEEFRTACLTLASGGSGKMMNSWEEVEGGLSGAFLFAKFDATAVVRGGSAIVSSDDSHAPPSRGGGAGGRDQRSTPQKPTPKRAHRPSPKRARPITASPSVAPAARGFLSMEMYQQQIMQRMGRAKFLRIFRQGEILQSRPSVPSYDEAAARLDELIERKEAELPSKKRTDEIIAAKEREDREREARESAMKLMRPLTAEERNVVAGATEGIGPPAEIVASQDADSVQRGSMQSLRPGQWLNDEVINYFLKNCLARRDEMLCAREPGRRRSHFFNSFFVQTMFDEKNNDPRLRGRYNYKNVRRWSKKVPGKDIFKLKYIFCPINLDNSHWTLAVIFMEDKRIQYYDSMGGTDRAKLEGLLEYVKDEYRAKNGKDMDTSEWELVSCRRDTPRQRNGELHLSV